MYTFRHLLDVVYRYNGVWLRRRPSREDKTQELINGAGEPRTRVRAVRVCSLGLGMNSLEPGGLLLQATCRSPWAYLSIWISRTLARSSIARCNAHAKPRGKAASHLVLRHFEHARCVTSAPTAPGQTQQPHHRIKKLIVQDPQSTQHRSALEGPRHAPSDQLSTCQNAAGSSYS
jgi:hypothetical protein